MVGLMKYVLIDKDVTDITMTNAFRKQFAHTSTGKRAIQQVNRYK